ncbi:hypothetical protein KDN24_06845 [Bacillus sp. Bva_UNVM-123]|uniref:hypothetical protein n=1 Tax=Bacillus sp. Bva_UNVM-123 TaxID=2829798 RepID=UPI00391F573B
MKGASEYYNIIHKAYQYKLDGLRKSNLRYGWNGGDSKAFLYKNVVFVTNSHARGKCFQIYLINEKYDNDEYFKNNAFEVYGVVDGQLGWTEEYGWIHEGNWITHITRYIGNLQSQADSLDHEKMKLLGGQKKQERKALKDKLNKYNKMFV